MWPPSYAVVSSSTSTSTTLSSPACSATQSASTSTACLLMIVFSPVCVGSWVRLAGVEARGGPARTGRGAAAAQGAGRRDPASGQARHNDERIRPWSTARRRVSAGAPNVIVVTWVSVGRSTSGTPGPSRIAEIAVQYSRRSPRTTQPVAPVRCDLDHWSDTDHCEGFCIIRPPKRARSTHQPPAKGGRISTVTGPSSGRSRSSARTTTPSTSTEQTLKHAGEVGVGPSLLRGLERLRDGIGRPALGLGAGRSPGPGPVVQADGGH